MKAPTTPAWVEDALQTGEDVQTQYQAQRVEFHQAQPSPPATPVSRPLFPGEKIVPVDSKRPSANYDPFPARLPAQRRHRDRRLGRADQPDWSKINYSSARAALLEAQEDDGPPPPRFATGFCLAGSGGFLEEAMDRGEPLRRPPAPDYIEARAAYAAVRWMGPPCGWIDP